MNFFEGEIVRFKHILKAGDKRFLTHHHAKYVLHNLGTGLNVYIEFTMDGVFYRMFRAYLVDVLDKIIRLPTIKSFQNGDILHFYKPLHKDDKYILKNKHGRYVVRAVKKADDLQLFLEYNGTRKKPQYRFKREFDSELKPYKIGNVYEGRGIRV